MRPLNACFPALTGVTPGEWVGLAVELLERPTEAPRLLPGRRGILSQIVGPDVIRARGSEQHAEPFHLMAVGTLVQRPPFPRRSTRNRFT
ncbi:hypothetical protein U14_01303 [Candidatus Moduliflexus flocculans]|uniref:Uncharacterized protein n=1 Tax=Candidatus Moduliflexus flocculans TaxID=1499966 RepID=A0A0S6VRQ6_9BACT|nr:hypothetical protein U14_01303 [Candidatus Moduliflexus flocculans]